MHQQVQGALGALGGGGRAAQPRPARGGAQAAGTSPATMARVQKVLGWLAEGSVDIEAVVDCVQELISLYEVYDRYKESLCKDPIAKFVKARNMDR